MQASLQQSFLNPIFHMHVVQMLQLKQLQHHIQAHRLRNRCQACKCYLHTVSIFMIVISYYVSCWGHDVVCQLKLVLGTPQNDLFHAATTHQTNHLHVPTAPRQCCLNSFSSTHDSRRSRRLQNIGDLWQIWQSHHPPNITDCRLNHSISSQN